MPEQRSENNTSQILEIERQSLIPPQTHPSSTSPYDVDKTTTLASLQPAHRPLYIWPLLVAAILAVSSAGTVFVTMNEVPPLTLASWRLSSTSWILAVLAIPQLRHLLKEQHNTTNNNTTTERDDLTQTLALLATSGTSLAFHFGLWVLSLQTTSLAHSLVLVCSTPIWITLATWILRKPLSPGEVYGALLGLVGSLLLGIGVKSEQQVSLFGDVAAVAASIALVPYLMIGRRLRQWMPVFVYAAPVTGCAATLLTLVAAVLEHTPLFFQNSGTGSGTDSSGITLFGWMTSLHYLPKILYLALGPGLVGHTGFNTLLKYLSPLTVALAVNQEPLFGSLLGWVVGVSPAPGLPTFIGGGVIVCSTALVTLASHYREKNKEAVEEGRGGGGGGQ